MLTCSQGTSLNSLEEGLQAAKVQVPACETKRRRPVRAPGNWLLLVAVIAVIATPHERTWRTWRTVGSLPPGPLS